MSDSKMKTKIILASGSPRRRALLRDMGLDFEAFSPNADESRLPDEIPEKMCERLARIKANAVAISYTESNTLVIAADTIVVIDGQVLGKPANRDEARDMLRLLQGRAHEVITGVALSYNGEILSDIERTTVYFRPLSESEIDEYVESGECDDKAGAYAIQGKGALLVPRIEGDYFNVVGLPLCRLGYMMKEILGDQ